MGVARPEGFSGVLAKAGRFCAGLAAAALLSACYESRDTIMIDTNGHVKMVSVFSVDTSVDGAPSGERFCEFEESTRPGIAISWETTRDGAMRTCTFTMSGAIEEIVAAGEEAAAGLDESAREMLDEINSGGFRRDGDVWTYTSRTAFGSQFTADPTIPPEILAQAASNLEGRTAEFSFTAPRIISSNGSISEDGTTATLVLPLVDEDGVFLETIEFEVRFSL